MIFKYAFFPNAILGGGLGYALKTAISQGVKRGLFSNEAGMAPPPMPTPWPRSKPRMSRVWSP